MAEWARKEYIKFVTCGELTSFIRQCECFKTSGSSKSNTFTTKFAQSSDEEFNNSRFRNNSKHGNNSSGTFQHMKIEDTIAANRVSKCGKYQMNRHWANDHIPNGTIRHGLPTNPKPITGNSNSKNKNKNTIINNNTGSTSGNNNGNSMNIRNVNLIIINNKSNTGRVGPLLYDGAPYSAIGEMELGVLSGNVLNI